MSKKPINLVDSWNQKYPIGQRVKVTKDDGTVVRTRTRSNATILPSQTPVVWLEGISGCYLLSRVRPDMEEVP